MTARDGRVLVQLAPRKPVAMGSGQLGFIATDPGDPAHVLGALVVRNRMHAQHLARRLGVDLPGGHVSLGRVSGSGVVELRDPAEPEQWRELGR